MNANRVEILALPDHKNCLPGDGELSQGASRSLLNGSVLLPGGILNQEDLSEVT